ncbi:LacI family transcriptional regulator [Nocardiopsis ansamitocini]|uniref:LacI family transcriptional regulator n=2 Tax=Nocardiopsis ansamitocini TaxID=1670832 RepID=A0A9W6UHG6_9ACTN|nr:LacI family transcriptional regulator [Nocardiopsis ansamitocini]
MADVARLAGVSHQTVSRVLNSHPNVKPATRTRVLVAIEELGYRRNSSARALVTRRTSVIGVVAFDLTLYGPARTLAGIEQAARAQGYFLSMVGLQGVTREAMREAMDYLAQQSAEGCIVIAPQRIVVDALAELAFPLPVVAVEGGEAPGLPVVCVDQRGGARDVVRHLLAQGRHRTVHHLAGPLGWLEAEGRVLGWRQALEEAGRPVPEPVYGDWSSRSGYTLGAQLAADPDVSALFVANDQMALGVLRALAEAGRRVPEDVSVAGFDDIPEAEFFTPPLTTVFQDFAEVGRRSINLLLDRIEAPRSTEPPASDIVPARLIARASAP